jgi:hypothetical protein
LSNHADVLEFSQNWKAEASTARHLITSKFSIHSIRKQYLSVIKNLSKE